MIPENEERLREVVLDPPALVVHVVKQSVVWGQHLERIPGEMIARMIINGFDRSEDEEENGLTDV